MAGIAAEIVKVAVETVAVKVVEEVLKNAPSAEQVFQDHPDMMNGDGVFLSYGSEEERPRAPPEEWNALDAISDD